MFKLYQNPISANVFDSLVYENCCEMASWNTASALLLASTTVIPVGFGFVTPLTPLGRLFLIIYAIVGIPLSLMVTSDIGRFFCGYIFAILHKSPWRSMIALTVLLASYPFLMGLLVSYISHLSLVDSIYYSVMCIFTIGYGDIFPPIPVPVLILLIVFGVTLVTVSVELVGSTVIHNVHYMGRQMNRAREIAGKVIRLAQKINVNRGLSMGISQLNAFTRLGMSMNIVQTIAVDSPNDVIIRKEAAFEPSIALDFVDFASSESEVFIGEMFDNKGKIGAV
uniref:Potassium channel domain-containing protein n=1 Tax=Panagrolaimus sp. PS1159 TaxID=55785 RepID=A0AC35FKZ4_9BILA